MNGFSQVLVNYRNHSFSERDKGDRFERLMQAIRQYGRSITKSMSYNDFDWNFI